MNAFEILSQLGNGTYSSVYKVRKQSDNKIYAVKKIKLHMLSEREKQNSINEVNILSSINNKFVIGFKEALYEENNSILYLVMEIAEKGDLQQSINLHLKQNTFFPEIEIWRIISQIVSGLKALHDLKILHRDIKCSNIFITKENNYKLGDFNVSKFAKNDLLQTQTGTPHYSPPEVWRDEPYSKKVDIWGLGCMIYEICQLKPPFQAKNIEQLYIKILKGNNSKIHPRYSKELQSLIQQCLQINPDKRPDCDEILNQKLVKKYLQQSNVQTLQKKNISLSTFVLPKNQIDRLSPQECMNRIATCIAVHQRKIQFKSSNYLKTYSQSPTDKQNDKIFQNIKQQRNLTQMGQLKNLDEKIKQGILYKYTKQQGVLEIVNENQDKIVSQSFIDINQSKSPQPLKKPPKILSQYEKPPRNSLGNQFPSSKSPLDSKRLSNHKNQQKSLLILSREQQYKDENLDNKIQSKINQIDRSQSPSGNSNFLSPVATEKQKIQNNNLNRLYTPIISKKLQYSFCENQDISINPCHINFKQYIQNQIINFKNKELKSLQIINQEKEQPNKIYEPKQGMISKYIDDQNKQKFRNNNSQKIISTRKLVKNSQQLIDTSINIKNNQKKF